jgi:hypothetical protein
MKVYKSNYRNHWISPYTILEKVCFWEKDRDAFYDHEDTGKGAYVKWVKFLNPICQAIHKFLDIVHPKIDYVKIDYYDTWSMDQTLSPIILPMLKQLQATKHGAPFVDDEDVPEGMNLRSTEAPTKENEWDTDENHFKRWDWVLEQMIWSFEQLNDDENDAQFHTGVHDKKSVACAWDDNGKATMYQMVEGENDTSHFDGDGYKAHHEKIQAGLTLFGKYYRNLWD